MNALDELIIETGLFLKHDSNTGREAQSRAFFRTPGTLWLYSGVAIRTFLGDASKSRHFLRGSPASCIDVLIQSIAAAHPDASLAGTVHQSST